MSDQLKTLAIDLEEIALAMENFGPTGLQYFLDVESGEVITHHDDFEDADEIRETIDEGYGERYHLIEPIESRESFRIMEAFAESLRDPRTKERLFAALSRNKPFRHFKDVVHSNVGLRDQWFAFRDDACAELAERWLAGLGVSPEWIRRRGAH